MTNEEAAERATRIVKDLREAGVCIGDALGIIVSALAHVAVLHEISREEVIVNFDGAYDRCLNHHRKDLQ